MAWVCRFIITTCVLIACCHLPARSQNADLTVVANGKGVPSEMNMSQLRAIMRGERLRWPDGSKVIIALMKSSTPIGVTTSRKIYSMSANELNKYWLALVFQGKADAPNFFNSEAELEEFISQTNGAIGVVNQLTAGSRTILIDGKKSL